MSVVLEERDIKVLARQVIEGLAYLHDNKIIHRGLKGSNLLITLDGCVKIGDLGCATVLDISKQLYFGQDVVLTHGVCRQVSFSAGNCLICISRTPVR